MSEVDELRERLVTAAKVWVRAYAAIDAGESDEDYADLHQDFMDEARAIAGALLDQEST